MHGHFAQWTASDPITPARRGPIPPKCGIQAAERCCCCDERGRVGTSRPCTMQCDRGKIVPLAPPPGTNLAEDGFLTALIPKLPGFGCVAGRFALNSLFGALAGASITLASFLSGVVAARMLGVGGAGAVAYAVWLALVIAPILGLGASQAVGRYVPEMRARGEEVSAERLAGRLARLLAVSVLAAIALTALVVAAWYLLAPSGLPQSAADLLQVDEDASRPADTYAYWALLGLYAAAQVFGTYVYSYVRGRQQFGYLFGLAGVSLGLQVAGVAAGSMAWGVYGALAGFFAGQVLPAIIAFRLMGHTGPLDDAVRSRLRRYARYAWAANVFVGSRMEIFFLERYSGSHDVGIFAAALALANLAIQGPVLLTTATLPLLAEQRGRGDREAMQAANETGTRLLAALVFPACLGTAAIMPVLVPLIYGPAFAEAVPAAIVLVSAASFSAITVVATNLVHAMERSDFMFFTAVLGAVLSILSGFVLIPRFGLMGAAVSRVAIQTLMVTIGAWFIVARLKYSLPFASLMRLLFAAAISAGIARFLVTWIAHPLILVVAIPAAAVAYVVALRSFAALPLSDLVLLDHVCGALPARAAQLVHGILKFIGGPIMPRYERPVVNKTNLCAVSLQDEENAR